MYHHLFDVCADFCLDYDITICAVEDTAGLKTPIVAFHALDCCLVLAGEGHAHQTAAAFERTILNARHIIRNSNACQTGATGKRRRLDDCHAISDRYVRKSAAIVKRIPRDSRHTVWDRHTCQTAATVECTNPDDCHAISDHHACQTAAAFERTIVNARHTIRNSNACQISTIGERILPDACYISSDFDCLRGFYPRIGISIIQPVGDHRLSIYCPRPVVFLRISIFKCYLSLRACNRF